MTQSISLEQFQARAMRLYGEKRYQEALEYVTREGVQLTAGQPWRRHFQACMSALLGQAEQAIQFLQTALNEGAWYPEWALRDDDLSACQGHLAFERLVTIFIERHEAAQARAHPLCLVAKPKPLPNPVPLLLVMHGNLSNGDETQSRWRSATEAGYLLAVAQSSTVEGPEMFVWNDEAKCTREISQHLAGLNSHYVIAPGGVVLGGFSMGGGEAIRLAVTGQVAARGFIAVAPYFRDLAALQAQITRLRPEALRGYIIIGDQDFSYREAREVAQRLKAAGIACELEVHPDMGHAHPPDFDQSLKRALGFMQG